MPVVTISRQYGSGGSEVADRVAHALGWKLYDNAVVDEVAARLGIAASVVTADEERRPSLSARIASAISLSAPEMMPTVGDPTLSPGEDRIVEVTARVVQEAVLAGPAVIVGRGAQALLSTRSDAIHVFCCAPADALAAYAITNLGVKAADAKRTVSEMNARREEYIRRHWRRDWRDPALYHLCINTAWLGLDGAAELITRLAYEQFG